MAVEKQLEIVDTESVASMPRCDLEASLVLHLAVFQPDLSTICEARQIMVFVSITSHSHRLRFRILAHEYEWSVHDCQGRCKLHDKVITTVS